MSSFNLITYPGVNTDVNVLKKLEKLEKIKKPTLKQLDAFVKDPKTFMQKYFIALPVATVLLMASSSLFSEKDNLIEYIHKKLFANDEPASVSSFVAKLAQNYSSIDKVAGDQRYVFDVIDSNGNNTKINLLNVYQNNYIPLLDKMGKYFKETINQIIFEQREYYDAITFPFIFDKTDLNFNTNDIPSNLDFIMNYNRCHYMNEFIYKMYNFMAPFFMDKDIDGNYKIYKIINYQTNLNTYEQKTFQLNNAEIFFGNYYTTYYNQVIEPYINSWGNFKDEKRAENITLKTIELLNTITVSVSKLILVVSSKLGLMDKRVDIEEIISRLQNSSVTVNTMDTTTDQYTVLDLSDSKKKKEFIENYRLQKEEISQANNELNNLFKTVKFEKKNLVDNLKSLKTWISTEPILNLDDKKLLFNVLSMCDFENGIIRKGDLFDERYKLLGFSNPRLMIDFQLMLKWVSDNFEKCLKSSSYKDLNKQLSDGIKKLTNDNLILEQSLKVKETTLKECQEQLTSCLEQNKKTAFTNMAVEQFNRVKSILNEAEFQVDGNLISVAVDSLLTDYNALKGNNVMIYNLNEELKKNNNDINELKTNNQLLSQNFKNINDGVNRIQTSLQNSGIVLHDTNNLDGMIEVINNILISKTTLQQERDSCQASLQNCSEQYENISKLLESYENSIKENNEFNNNTKEYINQLQNENSELKNFILDVEQKTIGTKFQTKDGQNLTESLASKLSDFEKFKNNYDTMENHNQKSNLKILELQNELKNNDNEYLQKLRDEQKIKKAQKQLENKLKENPANTKKEENEEKKQIIRRKSANTLREAKRKSISKNI
jgi:hypothetical protein